MRPAYILMLHQEFLYLNQKVTFRGHKGVFSIVLCLEGSRRTQYHINVLEKIASVYIIGTAEQQKVLRILNTIFQAQGI